MRITSTCASLLLALAFAGATNLYAHCDTMDGPVVKAAVRALETGNLNLVLIWVQKDGEAEIGQAFKKTMAVRKSSPEARDLADMYFFETLVRIHRAGEGEPYTGIKPAGSAHDPAVEASDKALAGGDVTRLAEHVSDIVKDGIIKRFKHTASKKKYKENDVRAGREYVQSYVEFVHYVENVHNAAGKSAHGHEGHSAHGH